MCFSFILHSLLLVGFTFANLALYKKRDALIIKGRVFHALYKLKQLHALSVVIQRF
jgi:hypothetical protein